MLTQRQSEYLAFIRDYATQFGRVPAGLKLAERFAVSHGAAYRMLETLCSLGELRRIGARSRNLQHAVRYELLDGIEDLALPSGLQTQLFVASERVALRPKVLLAQIVREYCERQK